MRKALASFARCLAPGGLVVANWLLGAEATGMPTATTDWVYPQCVPFMPERIVEIGADAGLHAVACPWPHPGLSWFVLAAKPEDLPDLEVLNAMKLSPPDWS